MQNDYHEVLRHVSPSVCLRRWTLGGFYLETFFEHAPQMNPNCVFIKGVVCGMRVEDPLMQKNRYLNKLIDELAKGKAMEKILRSWYNENMTYKVEAAEDEYILRIHKSADIMNLTLSVGDLKSHNIWHPCIVTLRILV